MKPDLVELFERLDYCQSQISPIHNTVTDYLDRAIDIDIPDGPRPYNVTVKVRLKEKIPVQMRIEMLSLVHEIRSILDALCCRLAERNGATKINDIYFPIFKTEEIFEVNGPKRMKRLSPEDQQKITNLSPYKSGNPMLFGLHELDKIRKHQKLPIQVAENRKIGFKGNVGRILEIAPREALDQEWRLLAKYAPWSGVGVVYRFEIFFVRPEEFAQMNAVKTINAAVSSVRNIVSIFN